MHIKDIEDAYRRVLAGDDEALEVLGLNNVSYQQSSPQSSLQFSFLEKQCQLTLEFISAIAAAKKVVLQHEVDGQDVAEIMLSLINKERQRYVPQTPIDISESDDEQGKAEPAEGQKEKDDRPLKRKAPIVEEQEDSEPEVQENKGDGEVKKKVKAKKPKTVIAIETETELQGSEDSESEESLGEEDSESEDSHLLHNR